ncbi:MAG TPA: DegT/DnrJ/EryC1/StrS family aminotransferase [Geminicoccaceae bacterium]|nr:DegT/DnrJ/EryC1/StrS family aminotransferase [Geminicoccaceae bacterium]
MHVYDRLGVKRRVNGSGTLTRLGGSLMPPEVLAAMAEAAESCVDVAELQAAASRVIARHTGAEAGIVTSGAAAALTLGTAACLTGFDAARMDRLPDTSGMPNEVVMCRIHRGGYDHAIRAAGARLVEVGFNDRGIGCGIRGVEPWEIEAAITPGTVAIAYTATPADEPPLAQVAAVAEAHGLPVIVDAAAQLPPAGNLRRFIEEGAALVAFSGGKAIRGPQASGILCGRRDLIGAAVLQQLDMDVAPETWEPPPGLIPRERLRGLPHHGLGRGFKVGKEEIAGLVVALERFASLDMAAELAAREGWLSEIAGRLDDVAGVYTRLLSPEETGGAPVLEVSLADGDAWALSRALQAGDPPVHLGEARAAEGVLLVKAGGLREGDAAAIAERLIEVLSS